MKDRTWYAREIAFLDSKAPQTEFENALPAPPPPAVKEKKSKKKTDSNSKEETKGTKKKKKQKANAEASGGGGDLVNLDLELTKESLESEVARLTEQGYHSIEKVLVLTETY